MEASSPPFPAIWELPCLLIFGSLAVEAQVWRPRWRQRARRFFAVVVCAEVRATRSNRETQTRLGARSVLHGGDTRTKSNSLRSARHRVPTSKVRYVLGLRYQMASSPRCNCKTGRCLPIALACLTYLQKLARCASTASRPLVHDKTFPAPVFLILPADLSLFFRWFCCTNCVGLRGSERVRGIPSENQANVFKKQETERGPGPGVQKDVSGNLSQNPAVPQADPLAQQWGELLHSDTTL